MPTKKLFSSLIAVAAPLLLVAVGCGDSGTSSTGTGGTGAGTSSSKATTGSSTISATSTGTGGVPPVQASDKCPGNSITLNPGEQVTLNGTTVGATDDYHEFCADSDATAVGAPDVVYQVVLPQTCSFTTTLNDMGFDGAVSIRQTCDTRDTGNDSCVNHATDGELDKEELTAGTYFVIVDSATKNGAGAFTLTLDCATPACGDGILNSAEEQCDPGPADPNDSCGDPGTVNGCKILEAPFADTCADITTPISVSTAMPVFVPASPPLNSSLSGTDNYNSPNCSNPVDTTAPDQVFEFLPMTTGTLSVTIGQNYNGQAYCTVEGLAGPDCFVHVMWFKSVDCTNGPELSCVYSTPATDNGVNTLSIPVIAGTPYFLFVEGNSSSTAQFENGPYLLKATLQ